MSAGLLLPASKGERALTLFLLPGETSLLKMAKVQKLRQEIWGLIKPFLACKKASFSAVVALALMLVYLIQGQRDFFIEHGLVFNLEPADSSLLQFWATLYQFAAAFLLFFVVPALLLKLTGEKLTRLGLGLGDWRAGLWVVSTGWLLIALPFGLLAGGMPEFTEEYPLARLATSSWSRFGLYQLAYGSILIGSDCRLRQPDVSLRIFQ